MKFLTLLLVAFCLTGNPKKERSVSLSKDFKVESTFSGSTFTNESFHLIIAKNIKKKQFEIIPISNTEGRLKQLESITFDKAPSILSFHNLGESISLIVSSKGKKNDVFTVVDLNLSTGIHNKSDSFSGEDFKAVIRKDTKNVLLFSNKESLKIVEVVNATSVETLNVETTENDVDFLKDLDDSGLEAVNTDEFVANGSISEFRVYSDGETVFITKEDIKEGNTTVRKVSLKEGNRPALDAKVYKSSNGIKKKSTSFVTGETLYQFQMDKDKGDVNLFDLSSTDNLSLDLSSMSISKKSKDFTGVENFLKNAAKSKNEPTITINRTKSGDLAMRVDYVNKREYNYQYNWWWHHQWMWHQQMMWHHQMMQQQIRSSVPTGFGPSQPDFDMYFTKAENHFFEIVFNATNENIKSDNLEMVHKEIDKRTYIDKLDEDTKVKYASTVFLDNELRYFGYDKKTKSFKVISEELND